MPHPIIEVHDLSKCYRIGVGGAGQFHTLRDRIAGLFLRQEKEREDSDFWALRDVSFDIQEGEVIGIIGANGAGKSTLLKILSRITEPTAGEVVLRGRVASLLEVGTGFHPELTGRENIFLNGVVLGMKRAEVARKFDEIVAFSGVEKFLDTPVKRYSSGMYVRLAFAVAAHLDPEILIVDEVLAVGDAEFQKRCLGKMNELSGQYGRTVLFVSHNMTAVQALCMRAVLLTQGRLKAVASANEAIRLYLDGSAAFELEKLWPCREEAPGTESIRLRRIALELTPANLSFLDVTTPFDVVTELWNSRPGDVLNVSLLFATPGGPCVFNTYSEPESFPEGVVIFRCRIPGHFLNDETYQIDVLIVRDSSVIIHAESAVLRFAVADGGRTGNWHGKHAGLLRPRLDWKVNFINNADTVSQIKFQSRQQ